MIVGWKVSDSLAIESAMEALSMAIRQCQEQLEEGCHTSL